MVRHFQVCSQNSYMDCTNILVKDRLEMLWSAWENTLGTWAADACAADIAEPEGGWNFICQHKADWEARFVERAEITRTYAKMAGVSKEDALLWINRISQRVAVDPLPLAKVIAKYTDPDTPGYSSMLLSTPSSVSARYLEAIASVLACVGFFLRFRGPHFYTFIDGVLSSAGIDSNVYMSSLTDSLHSLCHNTLIQAINVNWLVNLREVLDSLKRPSVFPCFQQSFRGRESDTPLESLLLLARNAPGSLQSEAQKYEPSLTRTDDGVSAVSVERLHRQEWLLGEVVRLVLREIAHSMAGTWWKAIALKSLNEADACDFGPYNSEVDAKCVEDASLHSQTTLQTVYATLRRWRRNPDVVQQIWPSILLLGEEMVLVNMDNSPEEIPSDATAAASCSVFSTPSSVPFPEQLESEKMLKVWKTLWRLPHTTSQPTAHRPRALDPGGGLSGNVPPPWRSDVGRLGITSLDTERVDLESFRIAVALPVLSSILKELLCLCVELRVRNDLGDERLWSGIQTLEHETQYIIVKSFVSHIGDGLLLYAYHRSNSHAAEQRSAEDARESRDSTPSVQRKIENNTLHDENNGWLVSSAAPRFPLDSIVVLQALWVVVTADFAAVCSPTIHVLTDDTSVASLLHYGCSQMMEAYLTMVFEKVEGRCCLARFLKDFELRRDLGRLVELSSVIYIFNAWERYIASVQALVWDLARATTPILKEAENECALRDNVSKSTGKKNLALWIRERCMDFFVTLFQAQRIAFLIGLSIPTDLGLYVEHPFSLKASWVYRTLTQHPWLPLYVFSLRDNTHLCQALLRDTCALQQLSCERAFEVVDSEVVENPYKTRRSVLETAFGFCTVSKFGVILLRLCIQWLRIASQLTECAHRRRGGKGAPIQGITQTLNATSWDANITIGQKTKSTPSSPEYNQLFSTDSVQSTSTGKPARRDLGTVSHELHDKFLPFFYPATAAALSPVIDCRPRLWQSYHLFRTKQRTRVLEKEEVKSHFIYLPVDLAPTPLVRCWDCVEEQEALRARMRGRLGEGIRCDSCEADLIQWCISLFGSTKKLIREQRQSLAVHLLDMLIERLPEDGTTPEETLRFLFDLLKDVQTILLKDRRMILCEKYASPHQQHHDRGAVQRYVLEHTRMMLIMLRNAVDTVQMMESMKRKFLHTSREGKRANALLSFRSRETPRGLRPLSTDDLWLVGQRLEHQENKRQQLGESRSKEALPVHDVHDEEKSFLGHPPRDARIIGTRPDHLPHSRRPSKILLDRFSSKHKGVLSVTLGPRSVPWDQIAVAVFCEQVWPMNAVRRYILRQFEQNAHGSFVVSNTFRHSGTTRCISKDLRVKVDERATIHNPLLQSSPVFRKHLQHLVNIYEADHPGRTLEFLLYSLYIEVALPEARSFKLPSSGHVDLSPRAVRRVVRLNVFEMVTLEAILGHMIKPHENRPPSQHSMDYSDTQYTRDACHTDRYPFAEQEIQRLVPFIEPWQLSKTLQALTLKGMLKVPDPSQAQYTLASSFLRPF